jgi:excisionase family DNA binding protein
VPRRPTDTYTVAEAAKVLGRSVKRVRQLIADGTLTVVPGSSPQRIPAEQVNARRRTQQRGASTPGPKAAPRGMSAAEFVTMLEAFADRQKELISSERVALEVAHARLEAMLREELDRERAARLQAEDELRALRAQAVPAEPVRPVSPSPSPGRLWPFRGRRV